MASKRRNMLQKNKTQETTENAIKGNIDRIQSFQSKVLRTILNAPWYVSNRTIHHDLNIPTVHETIQSRFKSFHSKLENHPNQLANALTYHPSLKPSSQIEETLACLRSNASAIVDQNSTGVTPQASHGANVASICEEDLRDGCQLILKSCQRKAKKGMISRLTSPSLLSKSLSFCGEDKGNMSPALRSNPIGRVHFA
ncbi:hypothetical protein AAG570_005963 [Ranatra chinensis]|uniref:Uncharacterized protein n=1 Tax=Ranatra chinensis TaxID=642074 RepID=A0ABD0XWZ3_9HEMI